MDPVVVVSLAVGVAVVIGYVLVVRVFFRDSKALDRKIDYAKMRKWEDDEDGG